jgi:hypothetical protein
MTKHTIVKFIRNSPEMDFHFIMDVVVHLYGKSRIKSHMDKLT